MGTAPIRSESLALSSSDAQSQTYIEDLARHDSEDGARGDDRGEDLAGHDIEGWAEHGDCSEGLAEHDDHGRDWAEHDDCIDYSSDRGYAGSVENC